MNGLSLFTGSGIGDLVFREIIPGYRTCCYIENDPFCIAHLIKCIKDGLIDDAPIWDDIRTFDTTPYQGMVDIVFGGFPCQPFSVAGKREGEADERNMWPDTIRVISEVRPRYAFLENVPGLVAHEYFRRIQGDLAEIFYDCVGLPLSAAEVGANHRREREWFLAYPQSNGYGEGGIQQDIYKKDGGPNGERSTVASCSSQQSQNMADTKRERQSQPQGTVQDIRGRSIDGREDVSDSTSSPTGRLSSGTLEEISKSALSGCNVSDTTKPGLEGQESEGQLRGRQSGLSAECDWWSVEPQVGRVVNGLAGRVHRLRMLGNGQVSQVVARILNVQRDR